MPKHEFWEGIWEFEIRDKQGKILEKFKMQNALVDQGERSLLDTYFRSQNAPSQFFVRLCNDTMDETDTLITMQGEPVGNGYVPQILPRSSSGFPTLELEEGDYMIVSRDLEFTAEGGDITQVNTAFLATTFDNSGLLIAFVNLNTPKTINDGNSLIVRFKIKMK